MGTLIAWVLVRDAFPGQARRRGRHRHSVCAADHRGRPGPANPVRPAQPDGGRLVATTRPGVLSPCCSSRCRSSFAQCSRCCSALDAEVEQAAACLGASRFTTFRRIMLPAILPAIAAGAGAGVRPGDGRIRLGGAHLRRLQFTTEIVVDVRVQPDRERRARRSAAATATVLLADQPGRDRPARHRPTMGGPPWLARSLPAAATDRCARDRPGAASTPRAAPVSANGHLSCGVSPSATWACSSWCRWASSLWRTIAAGSGHVLGRDHRPAMRCTRIVSPAVVAGIAVVINVVFGIGMALLLARYRFPGRAAAQHPDRPSGRDIADRRRASPSSSVYG